ncbi:hypothetical protein OG930_22825 [Streptomyces sp. NBC_01799]|uniref:hypothetical protein n=1 Tax=Streptomyces sp. NBC_01800 TaxID=2975945 RepID=UPI002DDC2177|nr:hypothetical protein [Streptomyces sp. NBC_01800]WSA69691.1 hypothetical protein OIE65_23530 [Streptomyces sp. NBC_01800]WSA78178.1 hypothetical protein OG930_22825 [Streptomyces sp. NBC_01799]
MRKLLSVSRLVTAAISAALAFGVAAPAQAAGGWNATVQCVKWRISDSSAHGYFNGHGWAKTQPDAWKAALKDANDQMPQGYRAKHCDKKKIVKG